MQTIIWDNEDFVHSHHTFMLLEDDASSDSWASMSEDEVAPILDALLKSLWHRDLPLTFPEGIGRLGRFERDFES